VDTTGFAANQLLRLQNTSTVDGSRMTLGFQGNSSIGSMLAMMEGVNYDQSLGSTDIRFSCYSGSAWNDDMVTFQHTGRVGIGTSSPTEKLEVSGKVYIESQGVDWNETNPGLTRGALHFDPVGDGAANTGNAITFGASDHSNGGVADAGIYTRSDGAYGSKMYFATTDSYAVGSKTRMMIDATGNVGIGTTGPDAKLTVDSTTAPQLLLTNTGAGNSQILMYDNSGGTQNASITFDQSGDNQLYITTGYDSPSDLNRIYFQPGGETAMTIRGGNNATGKAGHVGIGTDTPPVKLSINGWSYNPGAAANAGCVGLKQSNASSYGYVVEASANDKWMMMGHNGTNGIIETTYAASGGHSNLEIKTGSSNYLILQSSGGNVGIGTTSPQYKLDVDGQIRAEGIVNIGGIGVAASGALANVDINDTDTNGTSTSYQPNITFKAAGVLKAQIGKLSGSTSYFTAAKNFDGPVNIIASEIHSGHTHSQEYIFGYEPSNSGNTWGLNIVDTATTPNSIYIGAEGLHSTSSIFFGGYVNALLVTRISLNQTLGTWLYDCPDAGTSNVSVKWRKYNIGGYMANMIDFEDDGDIKNINGSYGTISSDERVKENIVEATSKLDDILSLKVKNFNFIGDNKKQIGLIAQEVEEVFPSWVNTRDTRIYKTHDEHGVPLEEQGELVSGYEDGKGLKVGMEFAVLVKTIQELNAKIVALESRINEM